MKYDLATGFPHWDLGVLVRLTMGRVTAILLAAATGFVETLMGKDPQIAAIDAKTNQQTLEKGINATVAAFAYALGKVAKGVQAMNKAIATNQLDYATLGPGLMGVDVPDY